MSVSIEDEVNKAHRGFCQYDSGRMAALDALIQRSKRFSPINLSSTLEHMTHAAPIIVAEVKSESLTANSIPMVTVKVIDETASFETHEASTALPKCKDEDDEETEDGDDEEKMKTRRMIDRR
ncbi:hypothetical protein U1Q18_016043 [Sarracenia purpurea var. burkii]